MSKIIDKNRIFVTPICNTKAKKASKMEAFFLENLEFSGVAGIRQWTDAALERASVS
jgi:hypothetical protein